MLGHGWLAVALLALFVGAQNPVVSSMEGSLTSSIAEERRLGTAFGVLNGVNGVGDLVSSVVAGVLWTLVSPASAFGFGAVLCAIAASALWFRPPSPPGGEVGAQRRVGMPAP
jgi:MFS family permease